MNTVISDGPTAIAASVVGTIAPTVRPMADAAKDSTVTMPQNLANLKFHKFHFKLKNGQITKKNEKKHISDSINIEFFMVKATNRGPHREHELN